MSSAVNGVSGVLAAQQSAQRLQIDIALAARAQKVAQLQGAAAVELIQAAGQISSPKNAASAGQKVDLRA
jgi:hypothetical protein